MSKFDTADQGGHPAMVDGSVWPDGRALRLYALLSRLPWPASYIGKIVAVAFLGTHVPLIALVGYFTITASLGTPMALTVLGVTLLATLLCTALSVFLLMVLLAPIAQAARDLQHQVHDRHLVPAAPGTRDLASVLTRAVAAVSMALDERPGWQGESVRTDFLTGTLDRRAGDARLRVSLAEERPDGMAFFLVLLDLDRLKSLNDAFGHSFGDTCLRRVGRCLRVQGATDWIARWGGDEFVIGVTCPPAEIGGILECLFDSLKENPLHATDGSIIILSMSAGVAMARPEEDVRSLFARADAALYQSKRHGRGSFIISEPDEVGA